jgi:hypothetical protein
LSEVGSLVLPKEQKTPPTTTRQLLSSFYLLTSCSPLLRARAPTSYQQPHSTTASTNCLPASRAKEERRNLKLLVVGGVICSFVLNQKNKEYQQQH